MKLAVLSAAILTMLVFTPAFAQERHKLWDAYADAFKGCKYVDLTHPFNPSIPVWPGFGKAIFSPCRAGADIPGYIKKGDEFTYKDQGFISTAYQIPTDQYGTHLDPPAHWDEYGATVSDIPPTFSVRPLVVVDIHEKVAKNEGYHCTTEDVKAWEKKHGPVPAGSVVMIRSDWHKKWSQPERFCEKPFPGITLDALKYLHLDRKILFHGHEPPDTDMTPNLEGEYWLMHHHFCQAENVASLDQVPEAGALILIGFAKAQGGTGGIARYIAVCPPEWPHGVTVIEAPGAPLPRQPAPLRRGDDGVLRPGK
ncbi:MAG: cyclase family protein [Candidatus Eremiobacteraeota bacterium]|nr:cyclase family protein [Candidatus Eremiobacteraeota bacterium]